MKPPIGFVLVTYNSPAQTLFLCERLNAMFSHPPIVIHHDFSQSPMNTAPFSKNVRFVEKWIPTKWGSMTVIDAQLSALRLLYSQFDPDWFVTLSTTDYPIQPADSILQELCESPFDAYMDSRPVKNLHLPIKKEGLSGMSTFEHPKWPQLAYNRYVAIPLLSRAMAKQLDTPVEKFCLPFTFLTKRLTPFHDGITCHGGDSWFTANRRIAHLLLNETPLWRELHRHYEKKIIPEESFYHTLLANSGDYSVCLDNKRYTDWRGCYAHPRTLGRADFPQLLESTHHFARKFPFDPEVLRDLDEAVSQNHHSPQ